MESSPNVTTLPIPRIPGHPVLGHLQAFRHDRVGVQLRVAREQPDIAKLRVGFIPAVMIGVARARARGARHEARVVREGAGPLGLPAAAARQRPAHQRARGAHDAAQAHRAGVRAQADRRVRVDDGRAQRALRGIARRRPRLRRAEGIMRLTLEIVGKTLFDAEVGSDADDVGDAVTVAMECAMSQVSSLVPIPPFVPTPLNLRNRRAVARLDEIVYRIIRERRAQGARPRRPAQHAPRDEGRGRRHR